LILGKSGSVSLNPVATSTIRVRTVRFWLPRTPVTSTSKSPGAPVVKFSICAASGAVKSETARTDRTSAY